MFAPVPSRLLFLGALAFLIGFAISVSGDTYSAWKARVFTDTEQADPAISGELALSPAADGIPNLLKYAFALDPHKDGSFALPQLSLMEIVDPESGQPRKFPAITYRVSSTDYPADLYFVPEISFDLQSWKRGETVFDSPISQAPINAGDPTFVTCRALLPVSENSKAFLRVRVFEGQTLPNDWQIANFGHVGVDPSGDADGDGRSNFQEFLKDTDPNDYYDGVAPELTVISGDNQIGDPSSVLALPLVVKVTHKSQPFVNAPVEFRVPAGSGAFGQSPGGDQFSETTVIRTSDSGLATAYFGLPPTPAVAITISISTGGISAAMSAYTNSGNEPRASMSIIEGNNQMGLPNQVLSEPFVVRLLGADGQPVAGATITFSISAGDGKVTVDPFNLPGSDSVTLTTNDEGLAWIYYTQGPIPDTVSEISVVTTTPAAEASFSARSVSYAPVAPRRVAVGEDYALACYSDGTVWAWGGNSRGQLGDGTTAGHWHRTQAAGLTDVIAVSAHGRTSAALRVDGTVWTWGSNDYSALGNGGQSDSSVPGQVLENGGAPLTGVVAIASGYFHNLALKADGTVWAWGADWGYQLGNVSGQDSPFALPVLMADGSSLRDVAAITCGGYHNLVLKSDGTVWAWGYNGEAELGTGDSDWRQATPAPVAGLTNVVAITGGATHSLALKSDGTIWSWGKNTQGCLGNGIVGGTQATPVQVNDLSHVIGIAAGGRHSMALGSNGTVWTWGDNSAGQLGVGALPDMAVLPLQTSNLTGVIALAAGGQQSFAITVEGSLLGWGSNAVGELGNRPQTDNGIVPRAVADFLLVEDPDHDGIATWREQKLGGDPNAYSTAGDTISDGWKVQYNFSLTDVGLAARDLTNKGLTVLQDFQLGTDPTKFSSVDDAIADGWKVCYQLDPLDPALADEDPSGKGWTVRMDYQLGTDPTRTSTLDDGIPDKWKVDHHANPLDASYAGRDDDQDGLSNAEEYATGTDPENSDTDGDGVLDGKDGWPLHKQIKTPPVPDMQYVAIDLGPGTATALNKYGDVVGYIDNYGALEAVLWQFGKAPQRLGFLTNDSSIYRESMAAAINDDGVVTGFATYTWDPNVTGDYPDPPIYPYLLHDRGYGHLSNFSDNHAFRWQPGGTMEDLNDLSFGQPDSADHPNGSNKGASAGRAINQAGTVVGYSDNVFVVNGHWYWNIVSDAQHAVQFSPGSAPIDLGVAEPESVYASEASGINDSGALVGYGAGDGRSAFLLSNTGLQLLDLTRANGSRGIAYATGLNNLEHVVGTFGMSDGASLWVNLPDLPPGERFVDLASIALAQRLYNTAAAAINDRDQIVGNGTLNFWNDDALIWQNGKLIRLNERIGSNPDLHLTAAVAINQYGMIAGNGILSGAWHAFLLVPAALAVDYNRDGKIDDKDKGKVTKDNPYRFWMNDDDDDGNTGGDDVPTGGGGNGIDNHVNGTRDLVDFFPVFLDIKNLLEVLPGDRFDYSLGCDDPFLNYVVTDLTPDTVRDYLIKLDSTTGGLDSAGALSSQPVQNVGLNGRKLDAGFLDGIQKEGKGIILVEARSKVTHPLKLQVTRRDTGEEVADVELPLSIDGVEKMYRHVNFLYADDAEGGRLTETAEPSNYPDKLCNAKTFVFVHGFYVSPDEARGWNAEIFKRMYWSGSKAKFLGVTWHGDETNGTTIPDYHKNVDNAFATAEHFALVLRNLGPNVTVAAHSLGNVVVGSAIQDWGATPANYFMIDAAVAQESYDAALPLVDAMTHPDWVPYQTPPENNYVMGNRVFASEWYKNPAFAPDDARNKLTWRDRLSRVAGNTFNFYSSSEDVLRKHEGDPGNLSDTFWTQITESGIYTWCLQEKLKGRQVDRNIGVVHAKIGSTYGGWRFSENIGDPPHTASPSEAQQLDDASLKVNPVFDPGFKLTVYSPSPEHPDGQIVKDVHSGAPDWITDLTDPDKGSATAKAHANQLLAEMFPARTLPAGANVVSSLGNAANFDMPTLYENSWPSERGSNTDWRHSDFKTVSYTYVYRLYEKFNNLAALDE